MARATDFACLAAQLFDVEDGERERDGFSLCGSPCNRDILSRGCIGRNNSRIPRGHRLRVLRSPGLVRGDTSPRYRIAARVSRSASEDRGVSRKLIPEIEPFVVRPYWCVCVLTLFRFIVEIF